MNPLQTYQETAREVLNKYAHWLEMQGHAKQHFDQLEATDALITAAQKAIVEVLEELKKQAVEVGVDIGQGHTATDTVVYLEEIDALIVSYRGGKDAR